MVDLTKLPGPERRLLAPLRPGPDSWDPPTPLTTDDQLLLDLLATHTYKCPTSLRDLARHLPESARPLGEQDLARRLDALAEQLTGRCRIHLGPDGVRLEEPDRGILLRHAELEDGTHAVIVLPFLSVCVYDPWDRQRPRRESLRPSLLRILTALVVAEGRPVPAQQLSDASGTSNLEHRVAELRRLQLPIPIGSSSGYRLAAVREALRRYPLAIDLARGHVWSTDDASRSASSRWRCSTASHSEHAGRSQDPTSAPRSGATRTRVSSSRRCTASASGWLRPGVPTSS
jgi:hypothetical protein